MRFLLDNNLAPRFADALNALTNGDPEVIHLRSRFAPETPDVEWLTALAKEGRWVVVSGDRCILRTKAEVEVLAASRITAFFLAKGWFSQTMWLQAERLVHWWPDLMNVARTVAPGQVYEVPFKGRQLEPIHIR